jgi:hypothetical protein
MAERPDPGPGGETARERTGLPAWVWIAWILLLAGAALGTAAWVESGKDAVPSEAPGRPEQFCNTVGELQDIGDLSLAVGEQDTGLQPAIDGLRRLADAEPPAVIRDDLTRLADALSGVQDDARAAPADDPGSLATVMRSLQDRLRDLQPASDRVDAYTEKWCGASLNSSSGDG